MLALWFILLRSLHLLDEVDQSVDVVDSAAMLPSVENTTMPTMVASEVQRKLGAPSSLPAPANTTPNTNMTINDTLSGVPSRISIITNESQMVNTSVHTPLTATVTNPTAPVLGSSYFASEIAFRDLVEHGHLLNPKSGCHMTRWVYTHSHVPLKLRNDDCRTEYVRQGQQLRRNNNTTHIQANDTIYVPIRKLYHFAMYFLDYIDQPFVLISGQWMIVNRDEHITWAMEKIIDNPFVIKWFFQQKAFYMDTAVNSTRVQNSSMVCASFCAKCFSEAFLSSNLAISFVRYSHFHMVCFHGKRA